MHKSIAALLLLLATNAFAFEGRPVSDLRFDGRASTRSLEVASDFKDFLILSGSGFPEQNRVFTQKVVDGKPVGPQRHVGVGEPVSLAWTGTTYLAAWSSTKALYVAVLSRDGSPIAMSQEPVVHGDSVLFAASPNGALAFGSTNATITVQPLDLSGVPVGGARTYAAPGQREFVVAGPAAGGFGLVFTGFDGTWLMLFRADGTMMTAAPILLDGPYADVTPRRHSNGAAVTTNGDETMVIFGAGERDGVAELKTAVVDAGGVLHGVRTVHTIPDVGDGNSGGDMIRPVGLVWDGSQFLSTVFVATGAQSMVRIARNGERIGELHSLSGLKHVMAVGWNGRELLLPTLDSTKWPLNDSFSVSVDPGTLTASPPVSLARTLATQNHLTIVAGRGGYLAAWFEDADGKSTVRASRVDRAGNYVDGPGVVVAEVPVPNRSTVRTIAIDGRGSQWFVVWTESSRVRGKTISSRGVPAKATITIAEGDEAAVAWDGTQYVVLSTDGSLNRTTVSENGVVGETKTLAEGEEFFVHPFGEGWVLYEHPGLALVGGHVLAVYGRNTGSCGGVSPVCGEDVALTALFLDQPGAVPLEVEPSVWDADFRVATSATQALVTWSRFDGTFAAFVTPNHQVTPLRLDAEAASPSVGFDGTQFMAAWTKGHSFFTARIAENGTISDRRERPLGNATSAAHPIVAASPTLPALVGFIEQSPAFDNVRRGALLFPHELDDAVVAPPAPMITCATDAGDDRIRVRWRPAHDILGIAIELQLPDGTFRTIGVAPSDATAATVSTAGLDGGAVRIRSWNEAGFSAPSATASNALPPAAVLQSTAQACAGVAFDVTATLAGVAPFTVQWSDGFQQSNVNAYTVTRQMTFDHDATVAIVSVTDSSCEAAGSSKNMRITVTPAPKIDDQTRTIAIAANQQTTLSVTTSNKGAHFAWYEGTRGDTSHPVGSDKASFTTPNVMRTTRYWVRLTTGCGSLDSDTMTVAVGRRRAVR